MASVSAGQTRRLRSLTLRQALFVFLVASLVAGLPGLVIPGSTAFAQTGTTGTAAAGGPTPATPDLIDKMLGTARVMQATMELIDVTMAQEPSAEEIAALRAQVAVVGQRVARVSGRVRRAQRAVQTGPTGLVGPVRPNLTAVDYAALQVVLKASQEIVALLRPFLIDAAADPASAKMATEMLQQLEALLIRVRDILTAQLAVGGTSPVARAPAWPASPGAVAPTISLPGPGEDLALLAQLASITEQLGLAVRQVSELPGPSLAAAGTGAPTQSAPASAAPPSPASDPMAAMMQHMQDMMSMMGGMGAPVADQSGSSGRMAGMAGSGAGMPVGAPVADTSLKRETHSAASMVQVQPLNLGVPGMATLDFYLTLDSHAGGLQVDLPATARLRLPSGDLIPPLQWVGPTKGEHIEGTLSFPLTTPNGAPAIPAAGTLVLVIDNEAVSGLQRFTWDLSALR